MTCQPATVPKPAVITVVEEARWWQELDNLRDERGEPLSEDTHRDCPGHGAMVHQQWAHDPGDGYRAVAVTTWVCADPLAHGHAGHLPAAPAEAGGPAGEGGEAAADAGAAAKRARAERRRVIANNKAWQPAETVRQQWVAQFLARKSPPQGALRFHLRCPVQAKVTRKGPPCQGFARLVWTSGRDGVRI